MGASLGANTDVGTGTGGTSAIEATQPRRMWQWAFEIERERAGDEGLSLGFAVRPIPRSGGLSEYASAWLVPTTTDVEVPKLAYTVTDAGPVLGVDVVTGSHTGTVSFAPCDEDVQLRHITMA